MMALTTGDHWDPHWAMQKVGSMGLVTACSWAGQTVSRQADTLDAKTVGMTELWSVGLQGGELAEKWV